MTFFSDNKLQGVTKLTYSRSTLRLLPNQTDLIRMGAPVKLLTSLSVLTAALALSAPVSAQSANKNVIVSANLTSVCRFVTSADLGMTVDYTAFQSTDGTKTGTADIECTRSGPAPSFAFDSGTAAATASASGTVAGLSFSVATAYAETAAGAAPSAGTPLGTPRTGTVTVTATIPAGQAGSGSSAVTAATAKVLTVTF